MQRQTFYSEGFWFAAFVLGLLCQSSACAELLRVGAAQVDITPKIGTSMAGYYKFRPAEGIRDPLFAKTIVVEQGGRFAVMVVLDLVATTHELVSAARKAIEAKTGVAGNCVMISATHTHSGPQLPRGSLMDDLTRVNSELTKSYMESLPNLIAQSVVESLASLVPVTPFAAIGRGDGISFNRRVLREGSGTAIWQPKMIDSKIERPAGPVDPEIGMLVFKNNDHPEACFLNFAMHPTSVGQSLNFSADYPGVFTRLVKQEHALRSIAVFANGCCGNINHGDYFRGKKRTTVELGTALADAVNKAWGDLQPISSTEPRVLSKHVTLPRPKFSVSEIERAKDVASRMQTQNFSTVELAESFCILETIDKQNVDLTAEVQAIAFSKELAIVSLPGEIFVELGLAIKQASPFKHTFCVELANGSIGYIPNRDAYPQGNYEVVSARCAQGSGELLVEAAVELLNALARPKP